VTFTLAGPTEPELLAWIRTNLHDLWSETAVDTILAKFDFAEKGSPSRNSRHKVGMALTDPAPDAPPFTRSTPEQAATNLATRFTITYKPVTATAALPDPVVVSRHQCPFCRRYTRADPAAVTRHMQSCFHNPGLRCCKTCTLHQQVDAYSDEACTHPAGPETEDYSFPVLNCPLWQPKEA
jgi:hypothetical protein